MKKKEETLSLQTACCPQNGGEEEKELERQVSFPRGLRRGVKHSKALTETDILSCSAARASSRTRCRVDLHARAKWARPPSQSDLCLIPWSTSSNPLFSFPATCALRTALRANLRIPRRPRGKRKTRRPLWSVFCARSHRCVSTDLLSLHYVLEE
jgi:hypothetical protein